MGGVQNESVNWARVVLTAFKEAAKISGVHRVVGQRVVALGDKFQFGCPHHPVWRAKKDCRVNFGSPICSEPGTTAPQTLCTLLQKNHAFLFVSVKIIKIIWKIKVLTLCNAIFVTAWMHQISSTHCFQRNVYRGPNINLSSSEDDLKFISQTFIRQKLFAIKYARFLLP